MISVQFGGKLLLGIIVIISAQVTNGNSLIFEDEDSFIIEGKHTNSNQTCFKFFYFLLCTDKWNEKLIIQYPDRTYSEISLEIETTTVSPDEQDPETTTQDENSCTTSYGAKGECMKVEDCYPYMFFDRNDDRKGLDVTLGLKEFIDSAVASEPCDKFPDSGTALNLRTSSMLNERIVFKSCLIIAAESVNQSICCVSHALPLGKFPQYVRSSSSENVEDSKIIEEDNLPIENVTSRVAGCGISRVAFDGKIVGGRPALKGEFPYIVRKE